MSTAAPIACPRAATVVRAPHRSNQAVSLGRFLGVTQLSITWSMTSQYAQGAVFGYVLAAAPLTTVRAHDLVPGGGGPGRAGRPWPPWTIPCFKGKQGDMIG